MPVRDLRRIDNAVALWACASRIHGPRRYQRCEGCRERIRYRSDAAPARARTGHSASGCLSATSPWSAWHGPCGRSLLTMAAWCLRRQTAGRAAFAAGCRRCRATAWIRDESAGAPRLTAERDLYFR
jgi:hypothetical protein